ncbi:MAG TPA: hypothetical protein VL442_11700, partial [Mucilaginibacter sp.]|nr:hypothetical protein [Mucilaginibacter sp.]
MKPFIPTYIIPVNEDQKYLTQVPELYPIPTDRIIDKTITGIGATYAEITNPERNSIIIMPNIAIINSKHNNHKEDHNTLAVWGNIPRYVISEYLDKPVYPKKLLITPEAFTRVKNLVEEKGINIYQNFFLLIDESHKTIKDVGYRNRIIEPMKYFFEFEGKALITATHLLPSDPRFINNGFKLLKVKPTYDYAIELDVAHVNNITTALKG